MRYTNDLGLPAQFVRAVSFDRHPSRPRTYSVTQVLRGVTETVLGRRHDDEIVVDVADNTWAIFGSAVHAIFEQSEETDSQLKEEYVWLDMPNGYRLTGIFDLYDASTGIITDWKTASVWRVMMHDWEGYRRQLLAYGVILRSMGFEVRGGQIVALLKDHSKSKARFDPEYPQRELVKVEWEFSSTELDEMYSWLVERLAEIERAESVPDDELQPCTPEERWHRGDKWAVVKDGNKKALKLWETREEAVEHAGRLGKGYHVEDRPGTDAKCEGYCLVRDFCPYWQKTLKK